jgi:hypothetical protein
MLLRALLRLNNRLTLWRRVRVDPGLVLLLVAHCLQSSACGRNLTRPGGVGCARCGRCPVDALEALRRRLGVQMLVVGGGRQALSAVRMPDIRAVVAVACERELLQGLLAVFPRPVLAVSNARPLGDCRDTRVELHDVEAALRAFIRTEPQTINPGTAPPST